MANGIDILGVSETRFFSHVDGVLRQWLEATLDSSRACRAVVSVFAGGERVDTSLDLAQGSQTCRCYAPVRWPRSAVADAVVRMEADGGLAAIVEGVTVGSRRPWTIYLLSDLCADDAWSYADLAVHDRDDYLTTLAELAAGPDNRYNLATVYQAERFLRQASRPEQAQLARALRSGRLHATPVPDQLLCGAFVLSAYPALLEPYRALCARVNRGAPLSLDAYHMEATTWSNGLVNLLACAGFQSFTKSLLQYQAPWIFSLAELPRLMRLEVAPGRLVYFLLRCGDYMEGQAVLKGVPELASYLHASVIPAHEALAGAYPLDCIPLVGAYGDLSPASKTHARAKVNNVAAYNAQGWEYPRLVNATFAEFFDQVRAGLGPPDGLPARALRAVRGDTGSSWEAWPLAAQAEMAAFRRAQRDVASLRVLEALRPAPAPRRMKALDEAVAETVYLGDHAWNGDAGRDEVKALNLAVRRRRLARIQALVGSLRRLPARVREDDRLAVVNTLAWERACRVRLPDGVAALRDPRSGETYPAQADGYAIVPVVPAFGARVLTAAARAVPDGSRSSRCGLGLEWTAMSPFCCRADGSLMETGGGWNESLASGEWMVGPFRVSAGLCPWPDGGSELRLEVAGAPPEDAYELCWRVSLGWPECIWRGESGGGFVTPGPVERGGDSLLGIAGSVFSAGEGLSAAAGWRGPRIDFAFDESGVCGLGARTTQLARGTYGERVDDELIRRASMTGCQTPGVLWWCLLGNSQNHRETLLDQGGCRAWSFRCGIREVDRPFDDAGLYRFAAGFNRPAELLPPGQFGASRGPWLAVEPDDALLVLGAARTKCGLEIDLYNAADRAVEAVMRGRAVRARALATADMLGRHPQPMRRGGFQVPPRAFVKVLAQ